MGLGSSTFPISANVGLQLLIVANIQKKSGLLVLTLFSSGDVFNKLKEILGIEEGQCTPDGKFSLDACRCIGACGLAPVMTVNDDVYGKLTNDQLKGILDKYAD